MSEQLILRLSSDPEHPISWLVWAVQSNEVIASGTLQGLQHLPQIASYVPGRSVWVMVNGADVRLLSHTLSTKPNRQLLKALPYLLEEELAEDVEQLHVILHSTTQDKDNKQYQLQLLVVRKQLLSEWQAALKAVGINQYKMTPDTLCMPTPEANQLIIANLDGDWLYRDASWSGGVIDQNWLADALAIKRSQSEPQQIISLTPMPETLSTGVEFSPTNLLMLTLAQGCNANNWSMLQGELAPRKEASRWWQTWRPVVMAGSFLYVMLISANIVKGMNAEKDADAAQAQLISSYKQAFPNEVPRINILRTQLQRKVAQSSGQILEQSSYLSMMDKLVDVLASHPQVKVDSMRYDQRRNELRLNANAANFQVFEQYRVALEALGLAVKQGAINSEGNRVEGSLSIQEVQ